MRNDRDVGKRNTGYGEREEEERDKGKRTRCW